MSMPRAVRTSVAAGAALAGMLAAGVSCARAASTTPIPAASCAVGDTMLVRDVVYFGRNRPNGGTVSDEEWRAFLDGVVTPRFPDGLTLVEATGQWRGQAGAVEQERSEIVTLLHAGDQPARDAVTAIAAEYKRRFAQEAVLRERTTTCARFE